MFTRRGRGARLAWAGALLVLLTGCKGVLGLDAPELDTCPTGCADAGSDALVIDASHPTDAPVADQTPGPIHGLPCGARGAVAIGCEKTTPICCQTTSSAGDVSYSCSDKASSCDGYPISCTRNDDCPGSDVCCHTKSAIGCVGADSCPDNELVCDPNGAASQCPNNWTCGAPVTNGGQTLPYSGCAQ